MSERDEQQGQSFEELSGLRIYTDGYGKAWEIRALSMRRIPVFTSWVLSTIPTEGISQLRTLFAKTVFLKNILRSPAPSIMVRLRRMLGVSDFSFRYIHNNFPGRNFEDIRNAAMLMNVGKSFDDWFSEMLEAAKKKTKEKSETLTDGLE